MTSHEATDINSRQKRSLAINYCTSKICGLVYLVETIAVLPHTTEKLREWYINQSNVDAKRDKQICKVYSDFLNAAQDKYNAADAAGRVMSLSQRIACMTIDCRTLDDLLDKLKPILLAEELDVVARTYRHFEPIYESSMWEPGYKRLNEQIEEFRIGTQQSHLIEKLEQVSHFMCADWPHGVAFDTIIIPLPNETRSSHADSVGKTQIVELIAEHTFAEQADVVFHELCHSLWGTTDQQKVQQDFQKFGGTIAYFELNEALATSLGQGWFWHSLFPESIREERWYSRDTTENYARGLYPLVADYLRDQRCLDTEFARQATDIFRETCPNALTDVCNTIAVTIITETPVDEQKLLEAMFTAMPGLRHADWIALSSTNLAKTQAPSQMAGAIRYIVMLSPDAIDTLTAHGLEKSQVEILRHRTSDCVCIDVRGEEIVFCIAKDAESQTMIFLELLNGKYPIPDS